VTPEQRQHHDALLARAKANVAARAEEHRAAHAAHCHWTYEDGAYRSPWFWPTRADAEQASRTLPSALLGDGGPRVFAVHAAHCMCAEKEGATA
jgi:hypothetical protein